MTLSEQCDLVTSDTGGGGEHPAHIHMGSIEDAPGAIAITFTPVNGATGMSMTNVSMTDGSADAEGEAITYTELLAYDGYINVHKSAEELDVLFKIQETIILFNRPKIRSPFISTFFAVGCIFLNFVVWRHFIET